MPPEVEEDLPIAVGFHPDGMLHTIITDQRVDLQEVPGVVFLRFICRFGSLTCGAGIVASRR
jgi:hypothetical protein